MLCLEPLDENELVIGIDGAVQRTLFPHDATERCRSTAPATSAAIKLASAAPKAAFFATEDEASDMRVEARMRHPVDDRVNAGGHDGNRLADLNHDLFRELKKIKLIDV